MTNETRELLYNKTADQITQRERDYLNDIDIKDYKNFLTKGTGFSIIGAWIFSSIFILVATGTFQLLPLLFSSIIGGLFAFMLCGALYLSAPSLKRLGLTRKEWKELKKSKRIKKINEIVNEFDYNRRLEMHKTNERLDEIISKHTYRPINAEANVENSEQVQEDNLSLVMKLTEKLSTEEKSTLITKLINEKDTNAQVENIDDRVEETPREKDYLKSDILPYDELDEDIIADIESVSLKIKDIINDQ